MNEFQPIDSMTQVLTSLHNNPYQTLSVNWWHAAFD